MPSDSKKKAAAKKKAASAAKRIGDKNGQTLEDGHDAQNGAAEQNGHGTQNGAPEQNGTADVAGNGVAEMLDDLDMAAKHRAVTGVLASHEDSRDLNIINVTLTFHGAELLVDTTVDLVCGRRYGLIGPNGCGKSSLLSILANREVPIPSHMDIFHLRREMPTSNLTALQAVLQVDHVRERLEAEADELASRNSDAASDRLNDIYEQLESMDASKAEVRAANILNGLGFTHEMQNREMKNFSGGWRMRVALARTLFIQPHLLLLDEPTNHLDLDACVWLEQYLSEYSKILVIISHSQDFLNGVCTNIIHMTQRSLKNYGGNYDAYMRVRGEKEQNQMKRYDREQEEIAHMKDYIARFGHGSAKLARQAQSKEKTLRRMVEGGLTEKVTSDKQLSFYFPECSPLPPPVLTVTNVSFRYSDDKPFIYKGLEFGLDLDTRLALVGPNGAGKSTLVNLLVGSLQPTDGMIRRHSHLKMGHYHQHLSEFLELDLPALTWMMKKFPNIKEVEDMRKIIGRYGLSGKQQVCPMRNLSDGQRCRVTFAWLAQETPHMLFLDEPTNHLDIETIDSLADAINAFNGGMVLVSHDFRLISQVAKEIWVCENQTVTKWESSIYDYKKSLVAKLKKAQAAKLKAQAAKLSKAHR